MSNKGKVFTDADLPRITQQRIANKQVGKDERAKLDAWLKAQTDRNRVVAVMSDGTKLIAEEVQERAMRAHAGGDSAVLAALRLLTTQLTDAQRAAVLDAFDKDDGLIIPFKRVK